MPELPEVETVRRGLEPAMAGSASYWWNNAGKTYVSRFPRVLKSGLRGKG